MLFVRHDDLYTVFKLGDGPILITDGYGGWEEVERPSNKPMSRWDGAGLVKLKIPLMFDAFAVNRTIGWHVEQALSLGRAANGTEAPPVFRLWGDAMPSNLRRKKWVMNETPDIGAIRRNRDGNLIHQEMTITVMEFVNPDRIRFHKKPKKIRREVAKKGDTINKIAKRLFKNQPKAKIRRWAIAIAELNKIRDRNKVIKVGTKIKIPSSLPKNRQEIGRGPATSSG